MRVLFFRKVLCMRYVCLCNLSNSSNEYVVKLSFLQIRNQHTRKRSQLTIENWKRPFTCLSTNQFAENVLIVIVLVLLLYI